MTTTSGTPISEADLQAYVDGELNEAQCLLVESYLAMNPDEAQRIKAYQRINDALQLGFKELPDEPIPEQLTQFSHFGKKNKQDRYFFHYLPQMAAGFVLFVVGALSSWMLYPSITQTKPAPFAMTMAKQAVYAHVVFAPEVRHPVDVNAAQEAHLVQWLSKRLDGDVQAPKLDSLGFNLVGGKLLPSDGQPAAQFMYENADKKRLTLYVKKNIGSKNQASFKYHEQDDMHAFYWMDDHFGYALIGDISRPALTDAATLVYTSLSSGKKTMQH